MALDLHGACREGDLGLVRRALLDEECDPNARDKHSRTPIHLAAWAGHDEVVEELLKAEGINVGAAAKDDTMAIHFACQKGHLKVVKHLLEKESNVNAKTRKGVTPLMMAAQQGESFCVLTCVLCMCLVAVGIATQSTDITNCILSPGSVDLVKFLLEKKANPLIKSNKGDRALDMAKTEVYDMIKEAMSKTKETVSAKKAEPAAKDRIKPESKAGPDTKKQKRVQLSHLDED